MMGIACFRAGEHAHPLGAWAAMRPLFEAFRADAPLARWGRTPWSGPLSRPWCFCYDNLGPTAGLLRGLFQYEYIASGLRLRPLAPPALTRYAQKAPAWFGQTRVYAAVTGAGPVRAAAVNGKTQRVEEDGALFLALDGAPARVTVEFLRGDARPRGAAQPAEPLKIPAASDLTFWRAGPAPGEEPKAGDARVDYSPLDAFLQAMHAAGLGETFEAGQARAALELLAACHERRALAAEGKLRLPDLKPSHDIPAANPAEIDRLYRNTARWVMGGLHDHLKGVSLQKHPVNPQILALARKSGLLP
jgi:hypothetical protein